MRVTEATEAPGEAPKTPFDEPESMSEPPRKSKRGGPRPVNPNNKGGRPRKDGLPAGTMTPGKVLPNLPGGRNATLEQIAQWSHGLTDIQAEHAVLYFYRTWPAWIATKFDPKAQKNIKIVPGRLPYSVNNFEKDFMAEFGSGDYYVCINEDNVNRWTVHFKTTRDFENYPPVLDYRLLDMSDPVNKTFIAWARGKGRLQDKDLDVQGSENEMAAAETLSRVVDIVERQSDRIADQAERLAQRPEAPDSRAQAELRGMEIVQEGAKETISLMRETMGEMARSQNQNNNPLEVVEKVVSLAAAMNGGNNKTDILLEMMRSEREIAARREDAARAEAADARKRSDELMMLMISRKDGEDKPTGLMGMLTELKGLKDVMADLGLAKGESGETESSGKSSTRDTLIELALRNAPVLAQVLDNVVKNVATAVLAAKGAASVAPGAAATPPPVLTTAPPPAAAPANPYTPFLTLITPAVLHHFNYGTDGGATFAQWLIESGPITTWPTPGMTGRGLYDGLKEQGPEAIMNIFRIHPPIWDAVKDTPQKLEGFIAEFLKADDPEPEEES